MRILHVIPSVAAARGGPSQAVIEMVSALRSQGVDAEILTTNDNGADLLDVPLCQRSEYLKTPINFFPRFSPSIPAIREFIFSGELTAWLWKQIKNYDLLHVHGIFSYPSTIAMTVARAQNIPYINRPFGQLCQWSLQQKQYKKELYLNLIEKANLQGTKSMHLTSAQEQKELELLGWNLSSFVVPHGLDLPVVITNARKQLHHMLNIPLQIPIILFLSRLHPKKGLAYLIPALGKLRDRSFAFVLAGSGTTEYEAELDHLLRENHLSDRTHKLGFVTGEKKDICLQGADLYALTSHSENFGIAVLEALASGTPALVTPGVALADLVKEQKLGWVADLEINAITSTIQEFLDHPQIAKQTGDRAAKYIAEHYTWREMANRLKVIYTNIIAVQ